MRVMDDQAGRLKQFAERYGIDADEDMQAASGLDMFGGIAKADPPKEKKAYVYIISELCANDQPRR